MKITVLNGSPKGDLSVTLQYITISDDDIINLYAELYNLSIKYDETIFFKLA